MSEITISRAVSHSVANVWAALDDFSGIHRWSAGVETSPTNPGTPSRGVGAERNCHLYDGNHIQERITQVIDQRRLAIEVFDTSMPLKSADAAFDIEPTSDGGTSLTMTFHYVVKFGLLGKAMDGLMIRRKMTASLNNLLAALDEHLRTGETIDKGWTSTQAAQTLPASA